MRLLKDEAYTQLLDMIFDGKFIYGETYSLNAVAEELQMSRTPVRDALQRLSNEGRIDILPSRGFSLHAISEDELIQRYHFSNAIEGYCVYYLAEQQRKGVSSPVIQKLLDCTEQMEVLIRKNAPFGEFTRLDNLFHHTLATCVIDAKSFSSSTVGMGLADTPELHLTSNALSNQQILDYHKRVVDAICAGNPEEAYRYLLGHADAVLDSYINSSKNKD